MAASAFSCPTLRQCTTTPRCITPLSQLRGAIQRRVAAALALPTQRARAIQQHYRKLAVHHRGQIEARGGEHYFVSHPVPEHHNTACVALPSRLVPPTLGNRNSTRRVVMLRHFPTLKSDTTDSSDSSRTGSVAIAIHRAATRATTLRLHLTTPRSCVCPRGSFLPRWPNATSYAVL